MKVLIIPEDPTNDQYILKPIIERLMRDLSSPVRVDVLRDPHLRGIDEALARDQIDAIIQENPMIDLFLLLIDRDCNRARNQERAQQRQDEHPDRLIAACAIEEVEVWMLALHHRALGVRWQTLRDDCDPKEAYADPFLAQRGWSVGVGKGRKRAMRAPEADFRGLAQRCPELAELKESIRQWLNRASRMDRSN